MNIFKNAVILLAILASSELVNAQTHPNKQPALSRAQWHQRLRWPTDECPVESPHEADSGVVVHSVKEGLSLVQIQCEQWTYQATYMFYLLKDNSKTQLKFKQFESADVGDLQRYESPLVTGSPTVAADGSVSVLREYRGAGDCGQYLQYQLKNNAAILKTLRVKECSEKLPDQVQPPQQWPKKKF